MAEPSFWHHKMHPLALALTPLSWLYRGLEAANRRFSQPQHPGKPLICVGNLTAGGAGKTPTTRLLAAYFAAQGARPAVLSRGYGGRAKGPLRVDPERHDAAETGDEPLMLAADLPVYIGADRLASLRAGVADGHDMFIKDDGFQNPSLQHGFNLIVVDGASGLGNGRLLPAGPLRQPVATALQRTDALLVLGAPTHASLAALTAQCAAHATPVFHGELAAQKPTTNGPVLAYCGIAKPEKFAQSLAASGLDMVDMRDFGDHHMFTEAEAEALLAAAADNNVTLITTEKDMARLTGADAGSARGRLRAASHVLKIDLHIADADALLTAIADKLAARQQNQTYKAY